MIPLGVILGAKAAQEAMDAMGRALDSATFHGIQENKMNDDHARITEVSATVDAGLTQEDLDGMNEAERLALIVGSAYGAALADRDLARATIQDARKVIQDLVDAWPETSWAASNIAVERAKEFIQATKPVDSEQTPTQED